MKNLFGLPAQDPVQVPPTWLIWFFDSPIWDMYSFAQVLVAQFPNAVMSSWWRSPVLQVQLQQTVQGAAALSSHTLGLAFDFVDHTSPDPQAQYDAMGSLADSYFPSSADGWWTADYSEGNLHFHIQRWEGWSSDWIAWVSAFVSWDPRIGPYLGVTQNQYQRLGLA